ncbi:unnamed protein product [Pleuronectes platessa]|uniref:Uncharacterized protein n=1 Tax=Pleuronectes platessa TaxID=8262 RepID=A0A9N7UDP5_PLEPL|nr:unnamed protein product [Pleuronectes platessa]
MAELREPLQHLQSLIASHLTPGGRPAEAPALWQIARRRGASDGGTMTGEVGIRGQREKMPQWLPGTPIMMAGQRGGLVPVEQARGEQRCTLQALHFNVKGARTVPTVRRAIIKHDGTRSEENIWHWWTGAGHTSSLPPLVSAQERVAFDLQLELSAVPLQINHADTRLA